MKTRLMRLAVLVLAVLTFVAGCGGGGSSSSSSATQTASTVQEVDCSTVTPTSTVIIQAFAFSPISAPTGTGGIVKWTNSDTATHSVTSGAPSAQDGKFDVTLPINTSKCLKFTTAGTFGYFCKFHTFMTGAVVVQ